MRYSVHIKHNVKDVKPSNNTETQTVQGQVMDLRQIGELYLSGTPLSMSNLPQASVLPDNMLDSGTENPVVEDYERRGVDMNDVWNLQQDAKERLGGLKRRASSYLTSAPTVDVTTPKTE